MEKAFGIDVGGSGIKGAIVDLDRGTLLGERHRIPTPQPATPSAVAATVKEILDHFQWADAFGVGLPAVVRQGVSHTAANIHRDWVGADAADLFEEASGFPANVLNDADAAGLAEMNYGAGRGRTGTVMMLTLGTGIGSALFVNGHLVPNTELGHLNIGSMEAEHYASDAVRKAEKLDWAQWAGRLNDILEIYRALLWPECFILGGGVSRKHEKFMKYLTVDAEVVPAQLSNEAGIVGAAMAAS